MQKISFGILLLVILVGLVSIKFLPTRNTNTPIPQSTSTPALPTTYTASFEVRTYGSKRAFTKSMYHDLNPDIYITAADPYTIIIKKAGLTWSDFFATLPMSLSSQCLVSGTKETFCTNDKYKLRFYLNDIQQDNALNMVINPSDHLLVDYR